MARYRVGVDVGGTFTDAIAIDEATGAVLQAKVPSTPEAEHEGLLEAVKALGIGWHEVSALHHGHTVAINALLTRTGAKTGLLCTEGHRDLLDIGRIERPWGKDMYNPSWLRPHQARPIVERALRCEVRERLLPDGSALVPLDEESVRRAAQYLRDAGVESIAICFVHANTNLEHERRAREIVEEVFPNAYIQTSEVFPVVREAERTTTVVLDAYVGRRLHRYLEELESRLVESGYDGRVLIMQMNAGLRTLQTAKDYAIWQLQSGPTAGLAAAEFYSRKLGWENVITIDMGGTSTDVGVIRHGRAGLTDEWTFEHGLTLVLPMVEVNSVGSGGGSIIQADESGSLRVGPESAGARPGPACYGRGGTLPTLTDAYVVLGLIEPKRFLSGQLPLDVQKARAALQPLADRLRLSVEELARGAFKIATWDIAESIRAITTYRGVDVRQFSLLAFGAAGPMQACYVAKALDMPEVLIPERPGGFCAFGVAATDIRVDRAASLIRLLDEFTPEELESEFAKLEAEALSDLLAQGATEGGINFERALHGMYVGQTWFTRMPVEKGPYSDADIGAMREQFHALCLERYGYRADDFQILVPQISATATGATTPVDTAQLEPADGPVDAAIVSHVAATLEGATDLPVYDRTLLRAGHQFSGPAIIDDHLATAVVPADATCTVDNYGVVHITF